MPYTQDQVSSFIKEGPQAYAQVNPQLLAKLKAAASQVTSDPQRQQELVQTIKDASGGMPLGDSGILANYTNGQLVFQGTDPETGRPFIYYPQDGLFESNAGGRWHDLYDADGNWKDRSLSESGWVSFRDGIVKPVLAATAMYFGGQGLAELTGGAGAGAAAGAEGLTAEQLAALSYENAIASSGGIGSVASTGGVPAALTTGLIETVAPATMEGVSSLLPGTLPVGEVAAAGGIGSAVTNAVTKAGTGAVTNAITKAITGGDGSDVVGGGLAGLAALLSGLESSKNNGSGRVGGYVPKGSEVTGLKATRTPVQSRYGTIFQTTYSPREAQAPSGGISGGTKGGTTPNSGTQHTTEPNGTVVTHPDGSTELVDPNDLKIPGFKRGGVAAAYTEKYIRGGGDGVSDDVPALIDGQEPAKLANNEYVLPARVVSEIGNGSSDAGAAKLDDFVKYVQSVRNKTKDVAADTNMGKGLYSLIK